MFCASMLGIGVTFRALLAPRGRKEKKPKEDKPTNKTQVVLTRIDTGKELQVPTVLPLQGNDNIPGQVMIEGEFVPVLRDQVAIIMETDAKTLGEARRLLKKELIRKGAQGRAEIAQIAAHEADHIRKSPAGVAMVHVVKSLLGEIMGAICESIEARSNCRRNKNHGRSSGKG